MFLLRVFLKFMFSYDFLMRNVTFRRFIFFQQLSHATLFSCSFQICASSCNTLSMIGKFSFLIRSINILQCFWIANGRVFPLKMSSSSWECFEILLIVWRTPHYLGYVLTMFLESLLNRSFWFYSSTICSACTMYARLFGQLYIEDN